MKHVLLLAMIALLPAPVLAQNAGSATTTEQAVRDAASTEPAPRARLTAPAQVQARPPEPPAPSTPPFRRRGSMVGYIDDAPVVSKVRLRFDTAMQNRTPDRAEFFYAKCGCYADLPPTDPAYDPDAPGPHPGAANDINFQQWYIEGEYAATPHFSVFGELPIRWIQPQSFVPGTGAGFPNQGGLSDLRVGIKSGLVSTDNAAVTLQIRQYLPTGDAELGLGTNHATVEPALLVAAGADRVSVESQVGVWLPFGGSKPAPTNLDGHFAGKVFFYGFGPSVEVYRTARASVAPIVELVGWHVIDGFESVATDASGTNILNLKIGGRVAWAGHSVYVGYGHALTDASWYDDIVRFEYRYEF